MEKRPGTLRIFCLGASTTVGYPYWYNGAFPAFLREHLRAVFPERTVEVVNLGMTATNSFTVLDMAREVVRFQPDAVVVYDGHNEFYGALGVASREGAGRSRWLAEAYLRLIHFRTFQLLRDAYTQAAALLGRGSAEEDRATTMERLAGRRLVPYESELYRQGVETFRENVAATVELCAREGVPLLLCTQVSNLRDLPPFASLHAEAFPASRAPEYDSLLAAGNEHLARGDAGGAAALFRAALSADSLYAGAWFGLASAQDARGDSALAAVSYARARDMDPVRFRAPSDINAVIRAAGAITVDAESALAAFSPRRIPGAALILEHLHPGPAGHALLAAAVARAMNEHAVLAPPASWRRDTVGPAAFLRYSLVTPVDDRIARRKTEILTSAWPFRASTVPVSAVAAEDTLATFAEMVTRAAWPWRKAHEAAAAYYAVRKDLEAAGREYRAVARTFPLDADSRWRFAENARLRGDTAAARGALEEAYAINPAARICAALGEMGISRGDMDGAIAWYRAALGLDQSVADRAATRYILGLALLKKGRLPEAVQELQAVLVLNPDHREAREVLRRLLPPGAR